MSKGTVSYIFELAVIQTLMRRTLISLFFILTIFSCRSNKRRSTDDYTPLILKRLDVTGLGYEHDNLQLSGYEHWVSVENYDDDAWDNFLTHYADKYLDTCTRYLPVMSITFCKLFNYKPDGDSRDLDPLQEHAILTISYTYETLYKKHPDIWGITFWHNGKATYVQTETLDRAKDKGYYDSAGNRKTDFVKEIDKKFHTHFYKPTKK